MTSIAFGYLPKINETARYGVAVAQSEFVKAVLSHGTYDRYVFLCDSVYTLQEALDDLKLYPNHERAEMVLFDDHQSLRQIDQLVLCLPDSTITDMVNLRKFFGKAEWPITGVTHSLSYTSGIPSLLAAFFEDMYSYDCLVCTSHAGRKVVENIIHSMMDYLSDRTGVNLKWQVQLPVIPLGVDASFYTAGDKRSSRRRFGIPGNSKVFLYVGRFSITFKMDPWPLLLSFSENLGKEKEDVLLVIAGNDSEQVTPQMKRFVNSLGIADKVLILPNITNQEKLSLYSAADVFLSPIDNVQETFGLAIIEAMSAGLAVIASDWNGYRESIIDGETGFLIPTYWADCVDHVSHSTLMKDDRAIHWLLSQAVSVDMAELGRLMRVFYDNPDLSKRMGEKGRQRVLDYYDWPKVIHKYEELWDMIVKQAVEAQQSNDGSNRHGVISYDFLKVFGHYSTGCITTDTRLTITPLGLRFLKGEIQLLPLTLNLSPFRSSLFYDIASGCSDGRSYAVYTLIQKARRSDEIESEVVFHHIIRLVKYCILEIVSLK